MNYTDEMVRQEIAADREDMMRALEEHEEVPSFLKSHEPFKAVWCSGCWLSNKLIEHGCPPDRVKKICFEHGQRSFHGCAYKCAAAMFNSFIEDTLKESPGAALGASLLAQHSRIERGPNGDKRLVLKAGDPEAEALIEAELEHLKGMTPEELAEERARMEAELAEVEAGLR